MERSLGARARPRFVVVLSVICLMARAALAEGAAEMLELQVRSSERGEKVFVTDKPVTFDKQGIAKVKVEPGKVFVRRELGGVRWPFEVEVQKSSVLKLPPWPRLIVEGFSSKDRDVAVFAEQPGVTLKGDGYANPMPEGVSHLSFIRAGTPVGDLQTPELLPGRTGRVMAWPLIAQTCSTDGGVSRGEELMMRAPPETFSVVDLSLLPPGNDVKARFGRCVLGASGNMIGLPSSGWPGPQVELEIKGVGRYPVTIGPQGSVVRFIDPDLALTYCMASNTARAGEAMATAAAATNGLEVRYEGFAAAGSVYLEAAECRLRGANGLLKVPRRSFFDRVALRFETPCSSGQTCPAPVLRKNLPEDPGAYPLVVDGKDTAGLEARLYVHRIPLNAELLVDGVPGQTRQERDGLSLVLTRGLHHVMATAEGRWPWSTTLDVKHGDRLEVDGRLDVKTAGWTAWLGWGAVGTVLAGAAVTGTGYERHLAAQADLDAAAKKGDVPVGGWTTATKDTASANQLAKIGGIVMGVGAAALAGWSWVEPAGRETPPEWSHEEKGR